MSQHDEVITTLRAPMAKRYGKYIRNEYDNRSEEEIEPCIDAALELLNLQSVEAYVSTRGY